MTSSGRLRFSILLPIMFLLVSLILAKIGVAQRATIIRAAINPRTGNIHEPLGEYAAKARFIDYVVNAPAWAAAWNMPRILHIQENVAYWGILRLERDWWYLLFVALMWYLIGREVDNRSIRGDTRSAETKVWRRRASRIFLIAYGLFICYTSFEYFQSPWNYPSWFIYPVFAWGVLLSVISAFSLSGPVAHSSLLLA